MEKSCANCVFWERGEAASAVHEIESLGDVVVGDCRRFPPSFHSDAMWSRFPASTEATWCGEWKDFRTSLDKTTPKPRRTLVKTNRRALAKRFQVSADTISMAIYLMQFIKEGPSDAQITRNLNLKEGSKKRRALPIAREIAGEFEREEISA